MMYDVVFITLPFQDWHLLIKIISGAGKQNHIDTNMQQSS